MILHSESHKGLLYMDKPVRYTFDAGCNTGRMGFISCIKYTLINGGDSPTHVWVTRIKVKH